MSIPQFQRLVRFVPKSDTNKVLVGEPTDETLDVGRALRQGCRVDVLTWTGSSILEPGNRTDHVEAVDRVLSPLARHEVGTIRCIGLNVCLVPTRKYEDSLTAIVRSARGRSEG
jgi:hypothetical protein